MQFCSFFLGVEERYGVPSCDTGDLGCRHFVNAFLSNEFRLAKGNSILWGEPFVQPFPCLTVPVRHGQKEALSLWLLCC